MSRPSCPWCGRTMDPGELESERPIVWYPSDPPKTTLRSFLSWDGIKELCAPITGNIRIPRQGRWEKAHNRLPAYQCPDCDRFIIIGRVQEG